MGKFLTAVLMALIIFSCTKNKSQEPSITSVRGTLWYADPAADGPGWYILSNDTTAKFYPVLESSIPSSFKKNDIGVLATLKETNKPFQVMLSVSTNINYYRIVTI